MKGLMQKITGRRERGQGLVETALILPFLLVLVVGVVEAGVALNRQLTVVNAAREGARLGANGAPVGDIYEQTLQATSDMFEFTETNAVVAVIHATTNSDGSGFTTWDEELYPSDASTPHVTSMEVLEQLNAEGDAANLKLVIVDVRYDHQSILGLPFVGAMADQIPIGSWSAMRLPASATGKVPCCALPIALPYDIDTDGDGVADTPLRDIPIGTELYDIRVGEGPGQFGWLFWDPGSGAGSQQELEDNLGHPCNAWQKFEDACDSTNTILTDDSWIYGDTGNVAAVQGDVEALKGITPLYVPVWDQFQRCDIGDGWCPDCPGNNTPVVHVKTFAHIVITKVCLNMGASDCDDIPGHTPGTAAISARFMGLFTSCGE